MAQGPARIEHVMSCAEHPAMPHQDIPCGIGRKFGVGVLWILDNPSEQDLSAPYRISAWRMWLWLWALSRPQFSKSASMLETRRGRNEGEISAGKAEGRNTMLGHCVAAD